MSKGKAKKGGVIIIRREEAAEAAGHGGAWKVAYADFVTAMMAFFLLMWLMNATTEQQRRGIADFFTPTNVLGQAATGSGKPFGGTTPHSAERMTSDAGTITVQPGPMPQVDDIDTDQSHELARPILHRDAPLGEEMDPDGPGGSGQGSYGQGSTGQADNGMDSGAADSAATRAGEGTGAGGVQGVPPGSAGSSGGAAAGNAGVGAALAARLPEETLREELAKREERALQQAQRQLRAAIASDPELADLAPQVKMDILPEGLRIQLLDADRQPMFNSAGTAPSDKARALLLKVAALAARLPNGVTIAGHTDSAPFRGSSRSNWELSSERATAARRILLDGGLPEGRVQSVAGMADRTPLLPDQPQAPANRRISITILRSVPVPAAAGLQGSAAQPAGAQPAGAQPAGTQPAGAQPAPAQSAAAQPGTGPSAAGQGVAR